MDSNLLKEAIADAKAVRQTALANAKASLEEAFGNRLEAMFAPQLEEETAETDVTEPEGLPSASPVAQPAPEEVVNQTDIEEIIRELEAELPQDQPAGGAVPAPVPAPPTPDASAPVPPMSAPACPPAPLGAQPVPPAPVPPADTAVPPAPAGEEMDEEIDIDELLESLKSEEEKDDEKEELDESVPVKSSAVGGKVGGSDNKKPSADASSTSHIESAGKDRVGGGEGYKSGPADATTAKRPNQAKNATKTNLSTPGGALKETTETGVPGGTVTAKEPTEAKRPNEADHATKTDLSTPGGALKEENEQLKTQLNEAEQALTYLRGQLNEINLLNAKLLYTNRLFKEYSMDNNKKMKIVEMFDLAKNVREVKMTYAVIAESLNFGADFQKKSSSKVQSITEGMASKPVAGTAPNKQIIAESAKSEMVQKFQRLAGIPAPKTSTK